MFGVESLRFRIAGSGGVAGAGDEFYMSENKRIWCVSQGFQHLTQSSGRYAVSDTKTRLKIASIITDYVVFLDWFVGVGSEKRASWTVSHE